MKMLSANVVLALVVGAMAATTAATAAASSPSITLTPAVLASSGDEVTVSFAVDAPKDDDIINIFAETIPTKPLGYIPVSHIKGWSTGSGSTSLPLVNMRQSYVFKYTQADGTVLAQASVTFAALNAEVTQIHLAATNDITTTSVMWTSGIEAQSVKFGLSPTELTSTATPVVSSYTASDFCGAPANTSEAFIAPGFFHRANMSHGQKKATTIYYSIGSDASGWSAVKSFVSAKPIAADSNTVLTIYADMGVNVPFTITQEQQPPSAKVIKLVQDDIEAATAAGEPSVVYHVGDISYARGWAFLWEYFFAAIQPVAQAAPYMVGIGNHEYDWPTQAFRPSWSEYGTDSGGECGVAYNSRFAMPGETGVNNYYYSAEFGNVHMAVISSETDFLPGSVQYDWLVSDLAAVDRSVTPWVIVVGHRPVYSSSDGYNIGIGTDVGHQDDYYRKALEPVFAKYKVNMAMYGHVHAYERTCGMVGNFTCAEEDSDGTVHVVMGCAGNVYNPDWAPNLQDSPDLQNSGHHDQPGWSIFRTMNFGYTRIQTNETHLNLKLIGAQRGTVHDEVTIRQRE